MVVAKRIKQAASKFDGTRLALDNPSDFRDATRGDRVLLHREQQFVIFSAVKGLLACSAGEDRRRSDFGEDAGGGGETVEIEGEAVAEVHGGGGAELFAKEATERQTRLGAFVEGPGASTARRETEGGSAERA